MCVCGRLCARGLILVSFQTTRPGRPAPSLPAVGLGTFTFGVGVITDSDSRVLSPPISISKTMSGGSRDQSAESMGHAPAEIRAGRAPGQPCEQWQRSCVILCPLSSLPLPQIVRTLNAITLAAGGHHRTLPLHRPARTI